MPSLTISQAMTANQANYNPLTGWQYEFVPAAWRKGGVVRIFARGTTAGIRITMYTGSQTIQQRSPVQGGGTAGTTPTAFTTNPIEFYAAPGDRLIASFDEVLGGTPTLDAVFQIDPVR